MSTFIPIRVGEVRRGQALHTFGIGSVIDLPHMCAMPSGLQAWNTNTLQLPQNTIVEDRLLDVVRSQLGDQVERLHLPPVPPPHASNRRDPWGEDAKIGVPVRPFPHWARCPKCEVLAPLDYGVFKLEPNGFRPDKTRYVHHNCPKGRKAPTVVPARHVVACPNGHVEDFPWREYVHGGATSCAGTLRFQERGLSSEVADLWVKCDGEGCSKERIMTGAFGKAGKAFFAERGCGGRHPHLGSDYRVECSEQPKAVLAGATNLWFPAIVSAITLPVGGDELGRLVDDYWQELSYVGEEAHVALLRQMRKLDAFGEWSDAEIWTAVQARKSDTPARQGSADLKREEWEVFSAPQSALETKDFLIRRVDVPKGFEEILKDVVLVDRMRVVQALTGFTRIDSPGNYGEDELPEDRRVPLSRSAPRWVPAAEVRGEGIFLRFNKAKLEAWASRAEVLELENDFRAAHAAFREARRVEQPEDGFPGMAYVVIHSLAHALLRQLSVECGYSAASVSERIYCTRPDDDSSDMAGVLLYTAAADSEGTLGGLVALGEPKQLERHLRSALSRLAVCPSDPLCCGHNPETQRGGILHGASCHSCTFVSETSCEAGNKYLDRSVLVRTVTGAVQPFFPEDLVDGAF